MYIDSGTQSYCVGKCGSKSNEIHPSRLVSSRLVSSLSLSLALVFTQVILSSPTPHFYKYSLKQNCNMHMQCANQTIELDAQFRVRTALM